jgi:hypothetical protein
MEKGIWWFDENRNQIGSDEELFSIPLFVGMKVSITKMGTYEVVSWEYHKGNSDEKPGLRIFTKKISEDKLLWPFSEPRPF